MATGTEELPLIQEDHFIPVGKGNDKIFLKRWHTGNGGVPVFCLHGSIENGRIFYTGHGKGLAPYLAHNGYDVFVGDLRGRGKSKPKVSAKLECGQYEAIMEDIPGFVNKIRELTGQDSMHWVAHSWGGVLLSSAYARFNEDFKILSQVYFGCKRRITVFNWERLLKMDIGWNLIGGMSVFFQGYLPAKELGMGADNEPRNHYKQMNKWISPRGIWIDIDGYDYIEAFKKINLPPTLYLAGGSDNLLGHPKDVKLMMTETNTENHPFHMLSIENGHKKDYGHIDMLTDKLAQDDVYPLALEWFTKHEKLK